MTAPVPDSLRWEAEQGRLLIDEVLLQPLVWPHMLKLERSADGLILTAWERQAAAEGQLVCVVTYESDEEEESATPYLAISAEQAQTLGLQSGDYSAWAARWDECIYAVPGLVPTVAPSGLVAVTLFLLPREVQLLEQLALQHQVRLNDILTAFATDLAAEHAVGDQQELRSGGSDERMHADTWFRRNVAPRGYGGPGADRPAFVRRFRFSPAEEQQQA